MQARKKRMISLFICAVMICTALFSILFIEKELNHDCTGADCPICASVHQAEQTLKQIGSGIVDASGVLTVLIPFLMLISLSVFDIPDASLVSCKVRLNN